VEALAFLRAATTVGQSKMRRMRTMYFTTIESPIEELLLTSDGENLTSLQMAPWTVDPEWVRDDGQFKDVVAQLREYFAGELRDFEVSTSASGTPFQLRVWKALTTIPYGETRSYGEIARQIRNPKAVRAVGRANGANPIAVIVPCHRVIGANGTLTGYGGGLDRKEKLLKLERVLAT
jgi:methylated-DNA-[protein]-cysteine S-methyltransferase